MEKLERIFFSPIENLNFQEEIIGISCGFNHSLVLTSSSDLYSWGYNYSGQLGLGNNNNQSSPQKIKIFNSISPKSLSFCSFNYHQRKILKEKRRKIVNILLLGRK